MTPEPLQDRAIRRVRRLPVFDAEHYRGVHPDLREVDPVWHFAVHGVWERRAAIGAERRLARLAELCARARAPARPPREAIARVLRAAAALSVRVRPPPAPSSRTAETADQLVRALQEAGVDAASADRGAPGAVDVFVDPARMPDDPLRDPAAMARLGRGVVLLSGPPTGAAFAEHLPCALLSAGVIALTPETHAVFAAAGAPALWLAPPPPPAPADPPARWRAALGALGPPDAPWTERPFDVAAFGLLTERRVAPWFALAEPVARRRSFVHAPRPRPELAAESDIDLRRYVYARSRVALHLQRDAPAAPDWRTVVDAAMRAGAVLVSDPGLRHPRLDPALHFFEAPPRRMPALLDWLLDTPDGRLEAERRRLAAASALARGDDLLDTGVRAAAFLLALGGRA